MIDPPLRSPRSKVGGIYHFGRMIDKIRCDLNGTLPEEYRPNLGLSLGLDGHLCGFLAIEFEDLVKQVKNGLSDDALLEWCFKEGIRLNSVQKRIWNGFAEKLGWRDRASTFLDQVKSEDGTSERFDLLTSFDVIDEREGRNRGPLNGGTKDPHNPHGPISADSKSADIRSSRADQHGLRLS